MPLPPFGLTNSTVPTTIVAAKASAGLLDSNTVFVMAAS